MKEIPKPLLEFRTGAEFDKWLRKNHAKADELWIRMFKKASGIPSIDWKEAVDACLCWGWIDGLRKGLDAESFIQRYTPRRPKSVWSQINRDNVDRLIKDGRMQAAGQKQVDLAKADGRWDNAYAPIRSASVETLPADLKAAITKSPKAKKALATLSKMNVFAIGFRVNNMKTEKGRAKKIADIVAMLERGETVVPR